MSYKYVLYIFYRKQNFISRARGYLKLFAVIENRVEGPSPGNNFSKHTLLLLTESVF